MKDYAACFDRALANYQKLSGQAGYPLTFLSKFRHSSKLYPHIAELKETLVSASLSDEAKKQALDAYFMSSKTKFNSHSFAIYLLDELTQSFPAGRFQQYYPKEKTLVFYTGPLYRGTLQKPEDAFENGIRALAASRSVEDYAAQTSHSTGVSTSKVRDIAQKYTVSTFPTVSGAHYEVGYLYEINYRGKGGIDIEETMRARGHSLTADLFAAFKAEVNIIGVIPPRDIVGYWDKNQVFHKNPSYQPVVAEAAEISQQERLSQLMTFRT